MEMELFASGYALILFWIVTGKLHLLRLLNCHIILATLQNWVHRHPTTPPLPPLVKISRVLRRNREKQIPK